MSCEGTSERIVTEISFVVESGIDVCSPYFGYAMYSRSALIIIIASSVEDAGHKLGSASIFLEY